MTQAKEVRKQILKKAAGLSEPVPAGWETIRSAKCPNGRETSDFRGVNSNGWIFFCPGKTGDHPSHSFVVDPA